VAENENVFRSLTAWRRRAASRLVHRAWGWAREAGAVTAERPGPLRFGRIGPGTRLAHPQGTVFGERWIHLGDHCVIGEQVTLTVGLLPPEAVPPGESAPDYGPEPLLTIGHGVVLGRDSHVVALAPITIGDQVFCGPNVYVTSLNHSYDDITRPVGVQWPRTAPVEIGAGSWLGANSVVLPGARLGRNVVVAAGSVVGGSVPDYAVVAGAPARVVRRWDPDTEAWQPPLRTPAPVLPGPRAAADDAPVARPAPTAPPAPAVARVEPRH
jgi:acetyltransferase-like isoleucine patch superfamily enzyme